MKLANAARYFDDAPVYDAYTGAFLWKCQFSSFNDANAIGSTSTRRVLSIAPGLALPARRALRIFDATWLVGDGNPDSWHGKAIRQSFNMKKATALIELLTPAEACLGLPGVEAYAEANYFKDTVNTLNDSNYDSFWNYFIAPGEAVSRGTFIRDSKLLRARGEYLPLQDLRVAQCDEVDAGPTSAVFQTGAFNRLTDTFADAPVTTSVLTLDYIKAYRMDGQAAERQQPGDIAALAAASAVTPEIGNTVTIGSTPWRIIALMTELDAWLMHLRRP